MTPEVIAERLHDWGYEINAKDIKDDFDKDQDVRESLTRPGAYELTQQAEFRIRKLIKDTGERAFQKTVLTFLLSTAMLALVTSLGIIGYGLATYNKNVRDLSFPEFRKRVQFDDQKTSATDRAKYLLYFITKVIQLKPDMTAETLADRLHDIGYYDVTGETIRIAFQNERQVRQSIYDKKAFQISPLAEPEFEERLELPLPFKETLTLRWLWEHVPWQGWASIISTSVMILAGSFYLGYRLALHSPRP